MAVHKSRGASTGLGICSYISFLFAANELTKDSKKLTDDEIAKYCEREFPNRPSAFKFRGENKTRTINEYRTRYNQGLFAPNKRMPERRSFRYNLEGQIVDGRTGKRLLSKLEIDGFNSSHKYWRDRQNAG